MSEAGATVASMMLTPLHEKVLRELAGIDAADTDELAVLVGGDVAAVASVCSQLARGSAVRVDRAPVLGLQHAFVRPAVWSITTVGERLLHGIDRARARRASHLASERALAENRRRSDVMVASQRQFELQGHRPPGPFGDAA